MVEILQEFYDVRLDLYRKRKEWLEGQLTAEASRLHHQARFILEKIDGKIVVGSFCVCLFSFPQYLIVTVRFVFTLSLFYCSCFHCVVHAENKKKTDMIEILRKAGYPSDPVKAWKESISTPEERKDGNEGEEEEEEGTQGTVVEKVSKGQPDYNYLLGMQMWSLTMEKKNELIQNRDKKV